MVRLIAVTGAIALLAAVMAWSAPASVGAESIPFRWRDLLGMLLCMVLARSAAMAFNRIADRAIDARHRQLHARSTAP